MQTATARAAQTNNKTTDYRVKIAKTFDEVMACQKLRYDVFATEMGAQIETTVEGYDQDHFDSHCRQLMVFDETNNKVAATTRILTNENAKSAGSFYSETEFNISNILALDKKYMEIGRTCVAAEYRTSPAINHLWQGMAKAMLLEQVDYLFGCVSIPLDDSGTYVHSLMQQLSKSHYANEEFRVKPLVKLNKPDFALSVNVVLPSLLKRYINIGAVICGEPCLDVQFNVADIFVLVDTKKINKRYQRHFLESA